MTTAPNKTLLDQMEHIAKELNCAVIYRGGMFHFIPEDSSPTTAEIVTSVELASQLLPKRTLLEHVARTLYECERRRADNVTRVFSGAGITAKDEMEPFEECREVFMGDAEAAIKACQAVELHFALWKLVAECDAHPGFDERGALADAHALLAKLEPKP